MRWEELVAGQPVPVGRFTIVPMIRVNAIGGLQMGAVTCSAFVVPVSVVVREGGDTYAFDLEGERVPVEKAWAEAVGV